MIRLIIFLNILLFSCNQSKIVDITVYNQTNFIEKSSCKIVLNDTVVIFFDIDKKMIADDANFDTIISFPINKLSILIEYPYRIEKISYFDKKLKSLSIYIQGTKKSNFNIDNKIKKAHTHYLDSFLFYPQIKVYPVYY